MEASRAAIVTGASTGIGEATAVALSQDGWQVIAVARREERLRSLAERIGCRYVVADLTTDEGVARCVEAAHEVGGIDALINNAGGARGVEPVAEADLAKWQEMYDINVLSALRMTRAFIPLLNHRGATLVYVTSTAAHDTYPGGSGYAAAKHAERMIPLTLRQELLGTPTRVVEIAPGMVKTAEFSLNRLGSREAAQRVYSGVDEPLVAEDVAEAIRWCVQLPAHMNVDSMIIRPVEQGTNTLTRRLERH